MIMWLILTCLFTSTMTGEFFKINHQLNCDGRCVIYLLTCKQCQKQYTEEEQYTDFRHRRNNYKPNSRKFDRKELCLWEHLYRDFNSPGHTEFLNDVSVTLIDKTDRWGPKKREDYWMKTLESSHSDCRYKCSSMLIQTIVVYFLALWLDYFDSGHWNLENDFVDATIYICYFLLLFSYFCRDVVGTSVNI